MRKQLTQLTVDRIKPAPGRVEISDHLLPALRLIVQPSGARSWAIRCRVHGKPAKLTIGDARVIGIAEARDKARDLLREVAAGVDPRQARRDKAGNTLGAVADQYLRHEVATHRKRTQEACRHHLNQWESLRHRPLAALTRREISTRLLELKDEHGPVAANRARSTLSALFTWAIRRGLVDVNPVAGTIQNEERPRERVLSLEELRAIWIATEDLSDHDAIVRLLALTGQRRSEVGGMRWSELDLGGATWRLPPERTKNGLPHVVPLSDQALEILKTRQRRAGRDYVFGIGSGAYSGWSRGKRRLDQRCGVFDWTLHDLRRSFVTHLCEIGVAPHLVESAVNHISGHKGGVAGIYNRSNYWVERVRALQLWADHLLETGEVKVVELPRRQGTDVSNWSVI
jgi:integrase